VEFFKISCNSQEILDQIFNVNTTASIISKRLRKTPKSPKIK
jgi:hypothetical protein